MNERDRLVKIMESEGMSARQFSQEIGISAGAISNIMSGRNKPSLDVLQAVLRRFRAISCDWLIMGVGNMYLSGNDELSNSSLFPKEIIEELSVELPVTHQSALLPNEEQASPCRSVDKILIFYTDGTFEER